MSAQHRRALLWLTLGTALWGLSFPLMKGLIHEQQAILPSADSRFLAAWLLAARFGLAALVLAPWVLRRRPLPGEIRQGLTLAAWGGFGMWLQADALAFVKASTSAFLTQGYCVFLPLWAAFRGRKPPGARVILATVMVLAGVAWLSGMKRGDLHIGRGEWETLAAAFLFTFQILALEDPRHRNNDSLAVSFVMFAAIAVCFFPLALLSGPSADACLTIACSTHVAGLIAAITVFSTLGSFTLMNRWQPSVSAVEAGLIYSSEPLFTAIYVLFLPGWIGMWTGHGYANETWTASLIGGGLLITGANLLLHLRRAS
jgi:drug/metabolite transporter (DMT)-like permease